MSYKKRIHIFFILFSSLSVLFLLTGCGSSSAGKNDTAPPSVPVIVIDTVTSSTYSEYTASLEGKVNVEIRPQVEGYIEAIYVDEGAYVKAGQPLFKINDLPYREQLNNALASQHAAEANLYAAELEVNKVTVLAKNNVVSEIQLKTAESAYKAAQASLDQAKAAVEMARINLGYTLIKAPVDGYIGRIPKRIGSLAGRTDPQALTLLSDVNIIYAYFAMSEMDFIAFNRENKGNSTQEKIEQLLPVSLILADGNVYEHPGKIEMVDGQFDKFTGSISLRAAFPNPGHFLRSGNTGKVQVSRMFKGVIRIPQAATLDMQDKVFVLAVGDSNKVYKRPVKIIGEYGQHYLISEGIAPGEKIVLSGLDRLQEGQVIIPAITPADSLKN